jgi:multidrug efflux pump subunit AcrA (membrane-fusion protein)
MDTEVDVTNRNLILMPGMYAEVNLTLDHRNQALALPVVAVDMDNLGPGAGAVQTGQVMIVTPNNRVEKRRVTLGIETANQVEIRSGLNEGDSVVLSGRAGLQPGQEVRPKVTAMTASTM